MRTNVCLCLTAPTLEKNLQAIEKYRSKIDIAELRVDLLSPDEQFSIRNFPERAGLPVILTVRRKCDGGRYTEGEGTRMIMLAKGLSYSDPNPRNNFAYIDLESDLVSPSLEEAARTFGVKIIRSVHYFNGTPDNLGELISALPHHPDEMPKVAVMPKGTNDTLRIFKASRYLRPGSFILLGMGQFGTCTRILAERLGSAVTFTTPGDTDFVQAGPGQLSPEVLVNVYRSGTLDDAADLFGIVGLPLSGSRSPTIHNGAFSRANINARYLPFPSDNIESFFALADFLKIKGFSVTVPYKERVLPYMKELTPEAQAIGAVNTVTRIDGGWLGDNTDAAGFTEAALAFLERKNLKGLKTTLVGAGGAGRAIAYALKKQGANVVVLNRTPARAMKLANAFGFKWGGIDAQGLGLLSKHSDFIVQATSAGMTPDEDSDPIDFYDFEGHEAVMDLVYKPVETKLLIRAKMSGARTQNGLDMLKRQAEHQFTDFTGVPFPQ